MARLSKERMGIEWKFSEQSLMPKAEDEKEKGREGIECVNSLAGACEARHPHAAAGENTSLVWGALP